jgi:hypothetical protein
MIGPEDGFGKTLGPVKGPPQMTGGQRWVWCHRRSRTADGAPHDPEIESIAKPPTKSVSWSPPSASSTARLFELMMLEEVKADWSHVWEHNTRPQIDNGGKPVDPETLGRGVGKLSLKLFNLYNDAELELEQTDFGDDKCDEVDVMLKAPNDSSDCGAEICGSIEEFNAGFKVTVTFLLVCVHPRLCL